MEIEVKCPEHGKSPVGIDEAGKMKVKSRVETLDKMGHEVHDLLQSIASDTNHPSLRKIIGASCDGAHSHGHACDSHEQGHHHERIYIDGVAFDLCDPGSLGGVLDLLIEELEGCETGCEHHQLLGFIEDAKKIQAKMAELSFCTKALCFTCLNQRRGTKELQKKSGRKKVRFTRK